MKFIFILAIVLVKVLLFNFLQVAEVVRTFGVNAFVDYKVSAFIFLLKGMRTVRTFEMKF